MNWSEMSFFGRIRFIVGHAEQIFVRAQIEGHWQSVALSELREMELITALHRFAKREVEPTRFIKDTTQ